MPNILLIRDEVGHPLILLLIQILLILLIQINIANGTHNCKIENIIIYTIGYIMFYKA